MEPGVGTRLDFTCFRLLVAQLVLLALGRGVVFAAGVCLSRFALAASHVFELFGRVAGSLFSSCCPFSPFFVASVFVPVSPAVFSGSLAPWSDLRIFDNNFVIGSWV